MSSIGRLFPPLREDRGLRTGVLILFWRTRGLYASGLLDFAGWTATDFVAAAAGVGLGIMWFKVENKRASIGQKFVAKPI